MGGGARKGSQIFSSVRTQCTGNRNLDSHHAPIADSYTHVGLLGPGVLGLGVSGLGVSDLGVLGLDVLDLDSGCVRSGCVRFWCVRSGCVRFWCVRSGSIRSGYVNWLWVCCVRTDMGERVVYRCTLNEKLERLTHCQRHRHLLLLPRPNCSDILHHLLQALGAFQGRSTSAGRKVLAFQELRLCNASVSRQA